MVEIIIGWGSCIVNQMVLAMFIFCSMLPMIHFPCSHKEFNNRGGQLINITRVKIIICAMIPMCISYVCLYIMEIKMMYVKNPPSLWTSDGALYALSGYAKALPFIIVFGYIEMKEYRQKI